MLKLNEGDRREGQRKVAMMSKMVKISLSGEIRTDRERDRNVTLVN